MERLLLIKYGEIHLKGQNRPFFKRALKNNLIAGVKSFGCYVHEQDGRIYVTGYDPKDEELVLRRVKSTFGIVGVCPALAVEKESEAMFDAALTMLKRALPHDGAFTFKVKARRQDKAYPQSSYEICADAGGYILDRMPNATVDVKNPQYTVEIEVRDRAYVYSHEEKGVGGLPVGVSGKGVVMLSGGIDSPVAAYMMAKRGLAIEAVHFLSPPYTGEPAKEKVVSLAKQLTEYCGPIKLHMVHFTEIQEQLYEKCEESYLTVLMRRLMCKITEAIALKVGGQALITGESLAQVASQTVSALQVTDSSVDMTILRPLIGMDKVEIIALAREIGTFDISTLPGEDCCTVFVPRHPATKPNLERAVKEEARLEVEALIADALTKTESILLMP
ncbi:MAG: tRNA 4-thiouridine(8) synthase ThiI [Clostridiales bacterium]|nr:tRNA 4-thiouridine(8) synthase ThiI [Clostridiales bacterium]